MRMKTLFLVCLASCFAVSVAAAAPGPVRGSVDNRKGDFKLKKQ